MEGSSERYTATHLSSKFRSGSIRPARIRRPYPKNDDVVAWEREIAVLRAQGLEPLPSRKYFYEIGALIQYLCGLVVSSGTDNKSPYAICVNGLVLEPTTKAISSGTPVVPTVLPVAGTKQGALQRNPSFAKLPFLEPAQTAGRFSARSSGASSNPSDKRASLGSAEQ